MPSTPFFSWICRSSTSACFYNVMIDILKYEDTFVTALSLACWCWSRSWGVCGIHILVALEVQFFKNWVTSSSPCPFLVCWLLCSCFSLISGQINLPIIIVWVFFSLFFLYLKFMLTTRTTPSVRKVNTTFIDNERRLQGGHCSFDYSSSRLVWHSRGVIDSRTPIFRSQYI